MKNILIALGNREHADQLIAQAVKLAKLTNGKIWISHVTESNPEDYLARESGPQFVFDERAEKQKKKDTFVKQCAKGIQENHGIPAEGFIVEGSVAKAIKQKVDEYGIDLVIAGHRKKDFLYELFSSNKKKDLVDELKIPLLAVPIV
ncbi:universal stress protein [Salinimicrobium xinjiangense]|uniref:universal stress protein n=1 Tax=Salinimicrobium xinjiangense TaxID=438596 RepID=UPI000412EAEE|nr:universal stress protein [Salinimicrobium xinjiangense]